MDAPTPTVLFLCTGNYYRSRYAELLFNHLAERRGLEWRADSRGLALERGLHNVGPIADCVRGAMRELQVELTPDLRMPISVTAEDLEAATLVVALKDGEHRPLVVERWPGWERRITYWEIHDVQDGPIDEALAGIDRAVRALVDELASGEGRA